MKQAFVFAILVCFLTVGAVSGFGQAQTADLHVQVRDAQGAAVTNANVRIHDSARGFERTMSNRPGGEYEFLLIPPGTYDVTVEAPGFARTVAKGVVVTIGQMAELPISLKVAAQAETVTVTGETEQVETQRSSMATTITQQRIDNLPINGRNYVNFALTNSQLARDTAPSIGAAPTSGLNVSGQRARSNLVTVDGVDAVDNSVNGIRSTVSQDAVQEFQILTNSYAAEYGRASGGVINIVTRSGSNDFHGSAFGYLRNRHIQADNPFSNVPNPAYTRVQAGVAMGGAIKKDKTFWYGSFEITRRNETGFSTIGANNFDLVEFPPGSGIMLTAQQAAFLADPANAGLAALFPTYIGVAGRASGAAVNGAWPLALQNPAVCPSSSCFAASDGAFPPGTVFAALPTDFVPLVNTVGNYPVTDRTEVWAARLDHTFNQDHKLMLRGNVSPSIVTGIQVNAQNQNFGQNAFSRTSLQTFHDVSVTAQETWTIGMDKINELRFQYARRGLRYTYAQTPDGGKVGVNIPGYAFFGREPFSFVDRVEQRYQILDNFSWTIGKHNLKFGADYNHLPLTADFTVNFGGIYNFGQLSAGSILGGFNPAFALFPSFSPVQTYGLGIPQTFIQGIGNPHDEFANKTLGVFIQDSWRVTPKLTLNYGVRYDVEFTPTFRSATDLAQNAENVMGITQGIPRDTNNIAPRVGVAWDPWGNGKTVVRASYGIFYDHPLLALAFDSDVADGTQAFQLALGPGSPNSSCNVFNPALLNTANIFQGIFNTSCYPPSVVFNYVPGEQRFSATPTTDSVFVNQNYFTALGGLPVPLSNLAFTLPTGADFEYAYSHQANFTIERDLGGNFALTLAYNMNLGRHQHRPININATHPEMLVGNWERAILDPLSMTTTATNPLLVGTTGGARCGFQNVNVGGTMRSWISPAFISFFRQSGPNPTWAAVVAATGCTAALNDIMAETGLGFFDENGNLVPVPFADATGNFSNANSSYHGLTANLRKRFSSKYEFLASYTWSHAIDESTDLQTLLAPQDNRNPRAERSNSFFDQRHRFVFSGVYQSGRLSGDGFASKFFSDWTIAPIFEIGSGRPFTVITGADTNFDFGSNTDRPNMVESGAPVNPVCQNQVFANPASPTGYFQANCFYDGTVDGIANGPFVGNTPRNIGTRPYTLFTDLRISKRIRIGERMGLDAIVDMFNLINRFNVADVNPLYTEGARTTAVFDPRQFQFGLRLSW